MDFEKINIEELHKALSMIKQQQQDNIDLVIELRQALQDGGFDYDEMDVVIHSSENKDFKLEYQSIFLYNLINALKFNNTLLGGYEPLFKQLEALYDDVLKNKLNDGLNLNLN